MHYRLSLASLCLLVFVTTPSFAQSTTGATTKATSLVGYRMYEALGLATQNTEFLDCLANVVSHFAKNKDGALIKQLAVELNKDPDPNELASKVLMAEPVSDQFQFQKQKEWQFGTMEDRWALAELMLASGKDTESTAPADSQILTRAAIVLAIQEEGASGPGILSRLLRDKDIERLSGWDKAALASINHNLADRNDRRLKASQEMAEAALAFDAIIQMKDPPAKEQLSKLLGHLHASLVSESDYPSLQWEPINMAWKVLNLLHSRNDGASVAIVENKLQGWKKEMSYPAVGKWIDECISIRGDAPSSSGIRVITSTDDPLYKTLMKR